MSKFGFTYFICYFNLYKRTRRIKKLITSKQQLNFNRIIKTILFKQFKE